MKSVRFIVLMSVADAMRIHDRVITQFGGRQGVHNLGLLESAVNHPWMIFEFGSDEDIEIHNLAATYFFHIIKNHPFADGNKRTGLLTALEFMYLNGFELDGDLEDLYEALYQLALNTAMSQVSKEEISFIFKKMMKEIE